MKETYTILYELDGWILQRQKILSDFGYNVAVVALNEVRKEITRMMEREKENEE